MREFLVSSSLRSRRARWRARSGTAFSAALACWLTACAQLANPARAVGVTPAIAGLVDFGSLRVQATMNQVADASTVSLIDTSSNTTVATTVTNATGNFTLNLPGWSPTPGAVYYLEAVKGLYNNLAGHDAARVRTLIEFSAGSWQSITLGGINITESTTALSVIESLRGATLVPPGGLIGKISGTTFTSAGTQVSGADYTTVSGLVDQILGADGDPVDAIIYANGQYKSSLPPPSPAPILFTLYPATVSVGAEITLYGQNFAGSPASESVSFNGATASIDSTSATLMVVTVPAISPGAATVSVTVGASAAATASCNVLAAQSTDLKGAFAP